MSKAGTLKLYLFNIKIQIINFMEFHVDFALSILLTSINILFYAFLWKSVYADESAIAGITWGQMIVYSVCSNLITNIFAIGIESKINDSVKTGNIAYLLSKPINLVGYWLSYDLGALLQQLVSHLLPIMGLVAFIIVMKVDIQATGCLLFIVSVLMSYLILWNISFLTGAVSFWYNELGTISEFKNLIILLLSGSFVPLWFFPEWIQKISSFLPFQSIYQIPLGILIGKYKAAESGLNMLFQLFWVVLTYILVLITYRKARKKLVVQGG